MTAILGGTYKAPILATVGITNQTVAKTARGDATATYSIANDKTVKDGSGTTIEAWLSGVGGVVSNYQVRATVQYGSLTSGTSGSWLSCGSTQSWSLNNANADYSTSTVQMLVEIRLASSGTVLSSATVYLNATSNGLR